jgi:hypothetical protein
MKKILEKRKNVLNKYNFHSFKIIIFASVVFCMYKKYQVVFAHLIINNITYVKKLDFKITVLPENYLKRLCQSTIRFFINIGNIDRLYDFTKFFQAISYITNVSLKKIFCNGQILVQDLYIDIKKNMFFVIIKIIEKINKYEILQCLFRKSILKNFNCKAVLIENFSYKVSRTSI